MPRPVALASFGHPVEAHLVALRLRSEGVSAWIDGELTGGLLAGVGLVRVLVDPADRGRAERLLREAQPPKRSSSADWVTGDLDAPRCARCGSLRVLRAWLRPMRCVNC
jgi:hypothetical protein